MDGGGMGRRTGTRIHADNAEHAEHAEEADHED